MTAGEMQAQDPLTHAVIGAAIEVHRQLGPGFLEAVYEEALCLEMSGAGIRFERQHPISVNYKTQRIAEARIDLLVNGSLIVELKAVDALAPIHTAQVISYLRASGLKRGLLINFNVQVLKDGLKRIVL